MSTYEITMTRQITESVTIAVAATCTEEAKELARIRTKYVPVSEWKRDACSSEEAFVTKSRQT